MNSLRDQVAEALGGVRDLITVGTDGKVQFRHSAATDAVMAVIDTWLHDAEQQEAADGRAIAGLAEELDKANSKAAEYCRLYQEITDRLLMVTEALGALRSAHHIPYADEDHQGGNCADIVVGLIAARMRTEASPRDWAAEAGRLYSELSCALDAMRDMVGYVHPSDRGPARRAVEAAEAALADLPHADPVCACISDEQAANLGPGFSRPVCAVHPKEAT